VSTDSLTSSVNPSCLAARIFAVGLAVLRVVMLPIMQHGVVRQSRRVRMGMLLHGASRQRQPASPHAPAVTMPTHARRVIAASEAPRAVAHSDGTLCLVLQARLLAFHFPSH
jgi:hypothetical protein